MPKKTKFQSCNVKNLVGQFLFGLPQLNTLQPFSHHTSVSRDKEWLMYEVLCKISSNLHSALHCLEARCLNQQRSAIIVRFSIWSIDHTGYSLSETLVTTSINPKYGTRKVKVQYILWSTSNCYCFDIFCVNWCKNECFWQRITCLALKILLFTHWMFWLVFFLFKVG